ncbi:GNAT family N-acetyltransferase [Candidatus Chlorohelix sp.]|uniref:GNAT family N-acetyltransferase n=1 Tax=Candidatus Chlorohelix sp. TaxID=3139201 RepID=UPI00302B1B00
MLFLPGMLQKTIATNEEWDSLASECDNATFFHTREWAELWETYTGGKLKAEAEILTLTDATRVLIPFSVGKSFKQPFFQYLTYPIWTYLSSFIGTYGGWISTRPLTPEQHKTVWDRVSTYNTMLCQNPFDTSLAEANLDWNYPGFTQAIDLEPGFDSYLKNVGKEFRRLLRVAREAGITVERSNAPEDWEACYQIYTASTTQWGNKLLGKEYKRELFDLLSKLDPEKMQLWVARYEGKVIYATVCFYYKQIVHCWLGVGLKEYYRLNQVKLADTAILEDACKRGYRWYDLGPSGGLEGVVNYKSSLKPTKIPANFYIHNSNIRKASNVLIHKARELKQAINWGNALKRSKI